MFLLLDDASLAGVASLNVQAISIMWKWSLCRGGLYVEVVSM